jgi:hypothetical protein
MVLAIAETHEPLRPRRLSENEYPPLCGEVCCQPGVCLGAILSAWISSQHGQGNRSRCYPPQGPLSAT